MNIVVLDDSKTVLMTIELFLEELGIAEEEIHLFQNGTEALEYIEQNGADIIFSDIQMPQMSGYEFVERLLALSKHFINILFIISADDNSQSVARMKEIGAKRFIHKPISAQHFNHFVAPEIAKIRDRSAQHTVSTSGGTPHMPEKRSAAKPLTAVIDLDHDTLAEKIGIPSKFIARLVESFLSESKKIIENLEKAIAAMDYAAIAQYSHALKGSSGNMKFNTLYTFAKKLEEAAVREDSKFPYDGYLQSIKEAFGTALDE
jgi:CheY-like chemotaxis protein